MMSNYSENRLTRFLTGKGFYVVLALCLVGAGAAAYFAVGNSMQQPGPEPQGQLIAQETPQAEQWGFPQLEEAARSQPGVAVEPSSQPPASSEEPAKPSAPASGQTQSKVPTAAQGTAFVLPVDGEIFVDFSDGELIKSDTLNDWRTHNGIDIKAEENTPVKTVARGKVAAVRSDPLWGFVVEVDHDGGLTSIYCGLNGQLQVRAGDEVQTGQIIGSVGSVPAESLLPSHLHFEMKKGGAWVNPLVTMNKK